MRMMPAAMSAHHQPARALRVRPVRMPAARAGMTRQVAASQAIPRGEESGRMPAARATMVCAVM